MTQRASSIHHSSSLVLASVFVLSLLGVGDSSMAQGRSRNDIIRRSRRPVAGRYLVAVRSNDDPDAIAGAAQRQARGRVRHVYRHAFRGFTIETSEATARALAADPGVAYVEEDGVVRTTEQQLLDESDNWGLDRIDQRAVSANGAGYDHTYHHAADGSGVNVYVIDTGIRTTHVEFGGRAFSAFDARSTDNVEGDCHGHGTHVAGIGGGVRFGVAKLVTLYSVRVLGCDGYGRISDVIAGIDWTTAYHLKPAVINMSIGATLSDATNDAIRGAIAAGITFVGAAGNENADSCVGLMGGVPDTLVVGASGYTDWREWYSNYGTCVDLFAPGGNIISAYGSSDTAVRTMRGTSMAAPHVAGAAALYLQHNPKASARNVAAAIAESATSGVIEDAGVGSPNRLLFTPRLSDTARPHVSVLQPSRGANIRNTATVSVSAEDDVEIANVIFFACGAQIGSDSVAPYSTNWDSTASPDGDCSVEVLAYDLAGNVGGAIVPVVVANKRDATPPHISLAGNSARILPANGRLVRVTFSGSVSDNESEIASVSFTTVDEYGSVQPSGVAAVTNGDFQITLHLEARRRGHDTDGRQYAMIATATDLAGNTARATAHAVVSHDRR